MILLFGLLAFWLPWSRKAKKAKPNDHEANDSAIRLICLFGSHGAKEKQNAKPNVHETKDSAIRLIYLFGSHVPRSTKAKANSAFRLWPL